MVNKGSIMGSVTNIKKSDNDLIKVIKELLHDAEIGKIKSIAGVIAYGDDTGDNFWAGINSASTGLVLDLQYVASELSGNVARSRNE